MIRPVYAFAVLGISLFSASFANSSELPIPYNPVEYKKFGNSYTWTPLTGATPSSGSVSFPARSTISTVEPKITTYQQLPFDKRVNPSDISKVKITSPITKVNFAKAFVAGSKVMTPIGAALTAAELLNYLNDVGVFDAKNTNDGLIGHVEYGDSTVSDGYQYKYDDRTGLHFTPLAACKAVIHGVNGATWDHSIPDPSMPLNCRYAYYVTSSGQTYYHNIKIEAVKSSCPSGNYVSNGECSPTRKRVEVNEQEILDRIASNSGWPTSAAIAAQSLINRGVSIETGFPTVSGPSSIPGSSTTTTETVNLVPGTNTPAAPGSTNTEPGTKTTNTTTTNNVTYNNNTATTTSTTNTVTNITNNVTNITITDTKSEEKENDDKEEDTPNDTPLGDIPDLYQQKYPDGIAGVLNIKFDELKASPLFSLPSMIMPTLPTSGSCPSWQLDFGLSSWAPLGVHTVEAPCWVWDFGKVVVIISALLLARRLIFGG